MYLFFLGLFLVLMLVFQIPPYMRIQADNYLEEKIDHDDRLHQQAWSNWVNMDREPIAME